jgi:hypothetical protein
MLYSLFLLRNEATDVVCLGRIWFAPSDILSKQTKRSDSVPLHTAEVHLAIFLIDDWIHQRLSCPTICYAYEAGWRHEVIQLPLAKIRT